MKTRLFTAALLLMLSASVMPEGKSSCDRNCVQEVKSIIGATAFSRGYPPSWTEKANTRLGDKVASAIRQIYRNRHLYSTRNVRRFLLVIKTAFALPNNIESNQDRIPGNSLGLLKEIKSKTADTALKQEISATIRFIEEKSEQVSRRQSHVRGKDARFTIQY